MRHIEYPCSPAAVCKLWFPPVQPLARVNAGSQMLQVLDECKKSTAVDLWSISCDTWTTLPCWGRTFFKIIFGGHKFFLWGQSGQPYSHLAEAYVMYVPRDSPLVWHLPTSWWAAWQLISSPHAYFSRVRMPDSIGRPRWGRTYSSFRLVDNGGAVRERHPVVAGEQDVQRTGAALLWRGHRLTPGGATDVLCGWRHVPHLSEEVYIWGG